MLKILLLSVVGYVLCAGIVFRVWLFRFPPKYLTKGKYFKRQQGKPAPDNFYYPEDTYYFIHKPDWYTFGWCDSNDDSYDLQDAMFVCILLWWYISAIVILRETFLMTFNFIYKFFTRGVNFITPIKYRVAELPQQTTHDDAEQYGIREVEKILTS
jgi:hypothetical protein